VELVEDAGEAAGAGPLLDYEGEGHGAMDWRGLQGFGELEEHGGTVAVAYCGAGPGGLADGVELALGGDGAEDVHAGGADFGSGLRAYVDVEVVEVVGIGDIGAAGFEVDGETGGDGGKQVAVAGFDDHGLRVLELVVVRRQAGLRQALDAEVAVGVDPADDVAGFIDGRGDEAVRRAGAEGDGDVAHGVLLRMEAGEVVLDLRGHGGLVATDADGVGELLQVVAEGVGCLRVGGEGRGEQCR